MVATEKKHKSQMVRDYLNSIKPSQRIPLAVVEAMKSQGVIVSAQYVSQIKSRLKSKKTKKSAVETSNKSNFDFDWKACRLAKDLLNSVGGDFSAAKRNLEIVAKLLSK